ASRGADFGSRSINPFRKARAYVPLIVPVTIRALERAEALAEAMEARCYSATGRTRYVQSRSGAGEIWIRLAAVAFALIALSLGRYAPF
ncbi:MAG TPA: CbiQ family ECF transporter T component, partial [Spirochaetales bacterium]|nr:CbiQ family ECF transporter T component [Spirochaetales bacterium]